MLEDEGRPIDESQDLGDRTDERDRGLGVVVEDDEIVQHDPADADLDED